MTTISVHLTVKPERVEHLKAFAARTFPETRVFADCQFIHMYTDQNDPTRMVFFEAWNSQAAHQQYLEFRRGTGELDELISMLATPPIFEYLEQQAA